MIKWRIKTAKGYLYCGVVSRRRGIGGSQHNADLTDDDGRLTGILEGGGGQ